MALMDHFAPNAGPIGDGGNGFHRIPSNGFSTLLSVLLNEADQVAARAELISVFNLDATDEIQLDELLTEAFNGSPTSASKQKYFRDVRDAFVGYEGGFLTKARAEANAGLTAS